MSCFCINSNNMASEKDTNGNMDMDLIRLKKWLFDIIKLMVEEERSIETCLNMTLYEMTGD